MINKTIFKKIKNYETTLLFGSILSYMLDLVPMTTPCVQCMTVDEESLIKLYLFKYPNPQPFVQILGPVYSLDEAINILADQAELTQEEREYLLELPNVEDNRPHHYVTILKELPDETCV